MVHLITGHAGKAHVKASDEAKINKALYGDAEAAVDYGNNFAITLPSNNAVQIDTGLFYMQGRWIDIPAPESVPFDNGVADMNRNDLVVFRYSMDPDTSVEVVDLVIKKGTSTSGTAEDPALETGLIDSGALVNEVPLYRIPISGINIGEPVRLFDMIQVNIREMQQGIFDTLAEVEANEEEGKIAGALAVKEFAEKALTKSDFTDNGETLVLNWL